jgi:hypothetical protein
MSWFLSKKTTRRLTKPGVVARGGLVATPGWPGLWAGIIMEKIEILTNIIPHSKLPGNDVIYHDEKGSTYEGKCRHGRGAPAWSGANFQALAHQPKNWGKRVGQGPRQKSMAYVG